MKHNKTFEQNEVFLQKKKKIYMSYNTKIKEIILTYTYMYKLMY